MIDPMVALREWHAKFDVPVADAPTLIPFERRRHRMELILEEYNELCAATWEEDLVEIADGLGDLLYVIYGAALEYGIPIERVFAEIHRSNMTKVWPDGTIHRSETGKILKPPTYSPADIKSIIYEFA